MPALTTELYITTASKTQVESRGCLNNLYECYFYNFNTFTTKFNTDELLYNSLSMANWAKFMRWKKPKERKDSNWILLVLIMYFLIIYSFQQNMNTSKMVYQNNNMGLCRCKPLVHLHSNLFSWTMQAMLRITEFKNVLTKFLLDLAFFKWKCKILCLNWHHLVPVKPFSSKRT